jgi:hypothetical protein
MPEWLIVGLGVLGMVIGTGVVLVVLWIALLELAGWRRRRRAARAAAAAPADEVAARRARRDERAASAALLPTSERRVRREPCGRRPTA